METIGIIIVIWIMVMKIIKINKRKKHEEGKMKNKNKKEIIEKVATQLMSTDIEVLEQLVNLAEEHLIETDKKKNPLVILSLLSSFGLILLKSYFNLNSVGSSVSIYVSIYQVKNSHIERISTSIYDSTTLILLVVLIIIGFALYYTLEVIKNYQIWHKIYVKTIILLKKTIYHLESTKFAYTDKHILDELVNIINEPYEGGRTEENIYKLVVVVAFLPWILLGYLSYSILRSETKILFNKIAAVVTLLVTIFMLLILIRKCIEYNGNLRENSSSVTFIKKNWILHSIIDYRILQEINDLENSKIKKSKNLFSRIFEKIKHLLLPSR